MSKIPDADLRQGLVDIGIDLDDLNADLSTFQTEYQFINNNVDVDPTDAKLLVLADRLDANIAKLPIPRRAWAL